MSDMNTTPLPYVGGKTRMASYIVGMFPEHYTYVEPFGGSAAVLIEKDAANVEVYNDLYSEVVNYFRVLRDSTEELQEYLKNTPYSREIYEDLEKKWYDDGDLPKDDVKRAAEYFYLMRAGINSLHRRSGFSAGNPCRKLARTYQNSIKELEAFAERFRPVIIENLDWSECIDKYDSEDTLFYCDPPYLEVKNGYYAEGQNFNHEKFIGTVEEIEGNFMCSYGEVPDFFSGDIFVTERVVNLDSSNRKSVDGGKEFSERLITDYDPEEVQNTKSNSATEADW